ncbi:ABC transporter substrate-binding protein [Clostridia bacterium]|nr:ABC transporter substrate-binding protein [Clostridia bacterium]
MKKVLSVLLTAAIALSLLAIPVAGASSTPAVVKLLSISGNGGHDTIVKTFNETHTDIQIELDNTAATWEDASTKLITLIAAGMAPDITTVSTSYYPQFASQGLLLDISDYVEANLNKDEYYWNVIEGLYRDGGLYGLPISIYTLVNYYNKDMFAAADVEIPSLDWKNAWTMEDWAAASGKLASGEGLNRIYGGWVEYQLERTAAFIFPEELDYWGEDLYPQFDNTRIRDIHEFLYDMVHKDKLMPDSATTRTTSVSQMFADGKLAQYITGTWSHTDIAKSGINYGVLPTPGGMSVGYVDVYIPVASTPNPDATMEVMVYLIGEEASAIKYQEYTWGPQINRAATEKNMDIMFAGLTPEEKQLIFDSLDNCRPLTVFDKWAEFLSASLLPVSEMMGIGEYTVTEGFDQLQEEALAILGY